MIKIYTDGACSGNPGPGGWGYVIINDGKLFSSSGSEKMTTNNRMELMAALRALEQLKFDSIAHLYTDSTYLQKGISEWVANWKANNWITSSKKPVLNKDLWIAIDKLNMELNIEWIWVKAHQSDDSDDSLYNNMADELATSAIEK
tara:strand:- start:5847 stop:6284 length:438 start_codon:yes stop_codon:yes gene_type:complete